MSTLTGLSAGGALVSNLNGRLSTDRPAEHGAFHDDARELAGFVERRLLNLSMGQCSGAAALVTADRLGLGAFGRAESVVAGYEQLARLDAELAEVQRAIDGCVLTWADVEAAGGAVVVAGTTVELLPGSSLATRAAAAAALTPKIFAAA